MKNKLAIILLAARPSAKMPECCRSFLTFGKHTLLALQLAVLKELFPDADVTVVVGHQGGRIAKACPKRTRILLNECYKEKNVSHSLWLGLKSCRHKRVLILPADLLFSTTFPNNLQGNCSFLDKSSLYDESVGACCPDGPSGSVSIFSYGSPYRFTGILHLEEPFLGEFKNKLSFCGPLLPHEVLNVMLAEGWSIQGTPVDGLVCEIDSNVDYKKALSFWHGNLTHFPNLL